MADQATGATPEARAPLFDMRELDGITNREEYQSRFQSMVRQRLQTAGALPPTDGVTKPAEVSNNLGDFFRTTINAVGMYKGPTAFEKQPGQYREERFNFIASLEGHRRTAYSDVKGNRTVGYGFNLDAPGNKAAFMSALGVDENYYNAVRAGTQNLSNAQTRALFESSVNSAEKLISERFGDVPLKNHQRTALISMAYNAPSLIGPKLTAAIRNGDWAAADYEIRHNSNRGGVRGLQIRRNNEANLFAGADSDVRKYATQPKYQEDMATKVLSTVLGISSAEAATVTQTMNPKNTQPPVERSLFQRISQTLPDNIRAYASFMYNKATGEFPDKPEVLNESSLSPDTVSTIRDLATSALKRGRINVTYADYDKQYGVREVNNMPVSQFVRSVRDMTRTARESGNKDLPQNTVYDGLIGMAKLAEHSAKDPVLVAATTVGQMSLYRDRQGNVIVHDPYDFSGSKAEVGGNAYNTARALAGNDGKAFFTYEINLGKIPGVNVNKLPLAPGLRGNRSKQRK